jgi:hypothetical protein
MPHPHRELSVNRLLQTTEAETWALGDAIAQKRALTLMGRADVATAACLARSLSVVPDPLDENPNHANVTGWPAEKSAQKLLAAELAGDSVFRER